MAVFVVSNGDQLSIAWAQLHAKQGTVVALGDGKMLESGDRAEFQVKVSDRVIFASYAGTEVTVDGEEYLLMSEEDILAVIED